jgi:hypothetical protein
MRNALALSLTVTVLFAVGCGEDAKPAPFADMQWLVRCDNAHGCAGNSMRSMFQFNGEEMRTISCNVQPRATGRVFGFKAFGVDPGPAFPGPYGIEVTNMFFMGEGSALTVSGSPACRVRVREEGNDFSGGCGPNPASMAQPCRFSNFAITGSEVSGELFCQYLTQDTQPSVHRELTGLTNATMPMRFDLRNCAGL